MLVSSSGDISEFINPKTEFCMLVNNIEKGYIFILMHLSTVCKLNITQYVVFLPKSTGNKKKIAVKN